MGDIFFNLCGWEIIRKNYIGDWSHEYGFFPVGWKGCGSEEHLVPIRFQVNLRD